MKIITAVLVCSITLLAAGCGTPASKPILNQGVWGAAVREDVFDACVKVLHFRGYMVQGISRDAGVVCTDWFGFDLQEGVTGQYKMNILVFKNDQAQTALSIKIKASFEEKEDGSIKKERAIALLNNKVSEQMKAIFADMSQVIGAPNFTHQFTLSVEE